MKIKLPTINIETDEYKYVISALMNYHGFDKRQAKIYLINSMMGEAERHCTQLIADLKGYIDYD